jgi:hypothetical protein
MLLPGPTNSLLDFADAGEILIDFPLIAATKTFLQFVRLLRNDIENTLANPIATAGTAAAAAIAK